MALTLHDYARLADACYAPTDWGKVGDQAYKKQKDGDQIAAIRAKLGESGGSDWNKFEIIEYQVGNSANGFQGVVFSASNEVICAYKGSKGGFASKDKMNTGYDDWRVNDVQIALNQIPSQLEAAEAFAKQSEFHAGKRRLTLVGHSLGGGLAQLAGAKLGHPFVTFNAPGMAGNVGIRKQASRVAGFNMILLKDPIGNSGQHIGKTERFLALGTTGPAHKMHAVLSALRHSDKWAKKTLDQLIGAGF